MTLCKSSVGGWVGLGSPASSHFLCIAYWLPSKIAWEWLLHFICTDLRPFHTRRNRKGPLRWNRTHVMKSQICGVWKWPLRKKRKGPWFFYLQGPDLLQNFAPLSKSPRSCVWNVYSVRNKWPLRKKRKGPWFFYLQGPDLLQNFAPLSKPPRSCVWNVYSVRNKGPLLWQGHCACAVPGFMYMYSTHTAIRVWWSLNSFIHRGHYTLVK